MIIDFHTHAFPDRLAARAIAALEQGVTCKAVLDGRVSSLLASMDRVGIDRSVVLSIATRPEQFEPIRRWSASIRSSRIEPFPSVHPADPEAVEKIRRIADEGFRGLKLHPYYQQFDLAESRMFPLYEEIASRNLIVISHTGFDIAFPRERIADPRRIRAVADAVPSLKFVATHFGAWEDWEEVKVHLLGRPIYLETSFALQYMRPELARELLENHPAEYLLFGTDSPWEEQAGALRILESFGLSPTRQQALLAGNAERLLSSASR